MNEYNGENVKEKLRKRKRKGQIGSKRVKIDAKSGKIKVRKALEEQLTYRERGRKNNFWKGGGNHGMVFRPLYNSRTLLFARVPTNRIW